MAKSKTGTTDATTLPEPTTWARAVVLGTGILGVSLPERTLSAKSLEELGRRVAEVARSVLPSAKKLCERLEGRIAEHGIDPDCDRLKTARSAAALCEAIVGKPPREVVEALATARLETSSSAVQASLAGAVDVLETLDDPLVLGVLKQLAGRERNDLAASKYLREARSIVRQDEMRRSLGVELRMVAGAAQAYLLSGTPSGADAISPRDGAGRNEADGAQPKSTVMASVVTPADVRIDARRTAPPPPPSQTRPKASGQKRSALSQTLASEGVFPLTRVGVERRGSVPDKKAALALLADATREATQKLEEARGPVVLTVVVTVDVSDKGK